MSLFDWLRPRWKHADPAVRKDVVRGLVDPQLLADIATNDQSDDVRLAAVEAFNDQRCLEQIAGAGGEFALAAFAKVSDNSAIARLAQSAESVAVRQRAVERIDDVAVLRCIACADPNAAVRALARAKSPDDSIPRVHLCAVLARLRVTESKAEQVAEFCGTMSEICRALARDPRFFINGRVSADEGDVAGATSGSDVCAVDPGGFPKSRDSCPLRGANEARAGHAAGSARASSILSHQGMASRGGSFRRGGGGKTACRDLRCCGLESRLEQRSSGGFRFGAGCRRCTGRTGSGRSGWRSSDESLNVAPSHSSRVYWPRRPQRIQPIGSLLPAFRNRTSGRQVQDMRTRCRL